MRLKDGTGKENLEVLEGSTLIMNEGFRSGCRQTGSTSPFLFFVFFLEFKRN